jgi:hypothetical protein
VPIVPIILLYFLGAISKLQKATVSFAMLAVRSFIRPSIRLSVFRMKQLGSHWTNFQEILYVTIFRKRDLKFRVSLQSDKNNGYFA